MKLTKETNMITIDANKLNDFQRPIVQEIVKIHSEFLSTGTPKQKALSYQILNDKEAFLNHYNTVVVDILK